MKEIWLEKYRPKSLSEVYGNDEALSTLRSCVQQGNIPHLILTGPPGTGKTSSVLCIAKQLLGDEFKSAVKQLNASDQRGIEVVRNTIMSFAKSSAKVPKGMTKIMILDEADSLTEGAQQALRMIMSNYSDTTRFVLSCNTSSKLIEPIQSRCIILRYSKLKDIDVEKNLMRVIKQQNVKLSTNALKTSIFIADGDMRQAINNLQACHYASKGSEIREELVLHICDAPSIQDLRETIVKAATGRINQSLKLLHKLVENGHSSYDLSAGFSRVISHYQGKDIPKQKVFEMMKLVSQLRARIIEGLTSELQLATFLSKCSMIENS